MSTSEQDLSTVRDLMRTTRGGTDRRARLNTALTAGWLRQLRAVGTAARPTGAPVSGLGASKAPRRSV